MYGAYVYSLGRNTPLPYLTASCLSRNNLSLCSGDIFCSASGDSSPEVPMIPVTDSAIMLCCSELMPWSGHCSKLSGPKLFASLSMPKYFVHSRKKTFHCCSVVSAWKCALNSSFTYLFPISRIGGGNFDLWTFKIARYKPKASRGPDPIISRYGSSTCLPRREQQMMRVIQWVHRVAVIRIQQVVALGPFQWSRERSAQERLFPQSRLPCLKILHNNSILFLIIKTQIHAGKPVTCQ